MKNKNTPHLAKIKLNIEYTCDNYNITLLKVLATKEWKAVMNSYF